MSARETPHFFGPCKRGMSRMGWLAGGVGVQQTLGCYARAIGGAAPRNMCFCMNHVIRNSWAPISIAIREASSPPPNDILLSRPSWFILNEGGNRLYWWILWDRCVVAGRKLSMHRRPIDVLWVSEVEFWLKPGRSSQILRIQTSTPGPLPPTQTGFLNHLIFWALQLWCIRTEVTRNLRWPEVNQLLQ